MIYQGKSSRRASQVARSQLAVRLVLAVYAALGALLLLRLAVLMLGFPETVWTADAILAASSPVVFPLKAIPAANRAVFGSTTLPDLTAALILVAAPLLLLGRRKSA